MMYTVAPLASKVLAIIKPIPWGEVQSTLGLHRCRLGASTYASAASDDSHSASEVEKVACSQGGEHCVRHDGLECASLGRADVGMPWGNPCGRDAEELIYRHVRHREASRV